MKNLKNECLFVLTLISLTSIGSATEIPKKTTAATSPMKECNIQDLGSCFTERSKANHGFRMVRRDENGKVIKTKYTALLIHGLSDSPYFYRDIAQILFKKGMNVLAIRNTGHGTHKSHLATIHRTEWYKDVKYGMAKAKELGENVILAGMSLGGSLVVREAQINPDVKGLILLSAAFKMPLKYRMSCVLGAPVVGRPIKTIASVFRDADDYQAKKEYGFGVRYKGIHNNATCQLRKINKEIYRRKNFNKIKIPVFNVVSEYDTALNKKSVIKFSSQVGSNAAGKSHLVLYRNEAAKLKWPLPLVYSAKAVTCMNHASVLLKASLQMGYTHKKCSFPGAQQTERFNSERTYDFTPEINFHFDFLKKAFEKFIDQNYTS